MGQAAKYIDHLLRVEKQSRAPKATGNKTFDLPGLRPFSEIEKENREAAKLEYTQTVRRIRELNKDLKKLKGEARMHTKQQIKYAKDHLQKMAFKIGTMSQSEATFGFEEVSDAE